MSISLIEYYLQPWINIQKIDYTSQRLEFVQILHRNKYVQSNIVAHRLISDWFEGLSTFSTCSMTINYTFSCPKNNEILFTVVTRLHYCNTLLPKVWNHWNVYVRRSLVAYRLSSDSRLVQRRDCRHFVRVLRQLDFYSYPRQWRFHFPIAIYVVAVLAQHSIQEKIPLG